MIIPVHLKCPVTDEIMATPTMVNCGHVFERDIVEGLIQDGTGCCPLCDEAIHTYEHESEIANQIAEYNTAKAFLDQAGFAAPGKTEYYTALTFAIKKQRLDICKILVRLGENINQPNKLGNTPAHMAFDTSNDDIIAWVLQNNPDLAATNLNGKTPIDIAKDKGLAAWIDGMPPLQAASATSSTIDSDDDYYFNNTTAAAKTSASTVQVDLELETSIATLRGIVQRVADICATADDVHTHTPELGNLCRAAMPLQAKYAKDLNLHLNTLADVTALALEMCSDVQRENVAKALTSIANMHGQEHETQLNVADLLRNTWALALLVPGSLPLIIDNLNHNAVADGGCDAGIAGRLVHPYVFLLNDAINNLGLDYQDAKPKKPLLWSKQATTQEDDLDYVIAMSLESKQAATQNDDLDQAIAMSLSEGVERMHMHTREDAELLGQDEEEEKVDYPYIRPGM